MKKLLIIALIVFSYGTGASADTLTVYPSLDGVVVRNPAEETWQALHDGAGTSAGTTDPATYGANIRGGATTNKYDLMTRGVFLFDTSALTANATISAATFSLVSQLKAEEITGQSVNMDTVTPASDSSLAASDYNVANWGGVAQATAITIASWVSDSSTYNDFTLNATGLSNISKTGMTRFGTRLVSDLTNTAVSGWYNDNYGATVHVDFSETTGTSKDPKLVITYTITASAPPDQSSDFIIFE